MFYTMEEAAVLGGFLELYLDRDSVDPAVRERHRKFRQGLLGGALERADYEWAAAALGFLRPQWWQEHEDHRALENALLKTRTLASKKNKNHHLRQRQCKLLLPLFFWEGGTHISTEKMKVLVVRPMELPAVQEIDHTLFAMQELVGGTIQAVYPFDDPVVLVCNDEGKLLGLPWNRALTDDHGVPYDIVCGTFFVAGLKEDDFASLTEQQIEKYKDKYSNEMILSVPKQPEAQKKPMKKEKHEYER